MAVKAPVYLLLLFIVSFVMIVAYYIFYSELEKHEPVKYEMSLNTALNTVLNKNNNDMLCSKETWIDDILSKFKPLLAYNLLKRVHFTNSSETTHLSTESEAVMLIIAQSISLNHSFSLWNTLSHGSLYAQKVNSISDIRNMGRYMELTQWDHSVFFYRKRQHNFQQMFIGDALCTKCGCVIQKEMSVPQLKDGIFYNIAKQTKTDKVTKHKYHILYDKQLTEFFHINKGIFLEIGLGCGMAYGAGESAKIWTKLFNNVHFIEYNGECVKAHSEEINNANYTVHIGDQADIKFLEEIKSKYLLTSPHGLDVIIDDGGHWNHQIIKSFTSLWHVLSPNGLYFIEDYGESAYDRNYADSQPVQQFGAEQPGTANYFIKNLLFNLFCHVSDRSCYDIQYIEARLDICVIRKVTRQ